MNYEDELKRLKESGNYWKPEAGQFKVKALTELEETDPFIKRNAEGVEEKHPQFKLRIIVDEEEKTWTFGQGKTPASTYGQLVHLATVKGNKLTDVEFTVVVKFDGAKNDYTIIA